MRKTHWNKAVHYSIDDLNQRTSPVINDGSDYATSITWSQDARDNWLMLN
jgi:hypothetical protein